MGRGAVRTVFVFGVATSLDRQQKKTDLSHTSRYSQRPHSVRRALEDWNQSEISGNGYNGIAFCYNGIAVCWHSTQETYLMFGSDHHSQATSA